MLWWSQPRQRQRWGGDQNEVLPVGNWGQIFFDLFYVGGAYNLGNVLKYSANSRGVLYFSGAAFPAMMMWFDKLYFDARFTTSYPQHDFYHRCLEVLQLCCVATALSRIRTVEILQDSCNHIDMFQFSISLLVYSLSTISKYVEVAIWGIGDPAAKVAARRDIRWMVLPTLCILVASIDSGFSYFANDSELCNSEEERNSQYYDHKPILFCLLAWVTRVIWGYFEKIVGVGSLKSLSWYEMSVPMNIHFCTHRYGEWFMIMFGESIVSLLIVDSHNESYNHAIAFYSGILSVIFLAHLHFQSEPKHEHGHALYRSRHSAYLYTVMVPIYSCALIAIGVSYKIFLYDFMYNNKSNDEYGDDDYHRRRLGGDAEGGSNDDYFGNNYEAALMYKRQFTANLFSGGIAMVLLSTDLMVLLHKGIPGMILYARTKISKVKLTLVVLAKYSIIAFLGCLCLLQPNPHLMIFCGLGAILAQDFLRNIFRGGNNEGSDFFQGDSKLDDDATAVSDDTVVSNISIHYFYQVATQNIAGGDINIPKQQQRQDQTLKDEGQGDADNGSMLAGGETMTPHEAEGVIKVESGVAISMSADHDSKISCYGRAESLEMDTCNDYHDGSESSVTESGVTSSSNYRRMAEF